MFNTHKFCCWALKLNLVKPFQEFLFEYGLGSWIGIFQSGIRIIIIIIIIIVDIHKQLLAHKHTPHTTEHSYWILLRLTTRRFEQYNKYIISFHDISAFSIDAIHQICNSNLRAVYLFYLLYSAPLPHQPLTSFSNFVILLCILYIVHPICLIDYPRLLHLFGLAHQSMCISTCYKAHKCVQFFLGCL